MDSQNVDLKQTVNLPKTAFPMKANLPVSEVKTLARWYEQDLYARIRAARAGRPRYVLHDGPPYANGRIHLGTAFNKILKDFVVKSKTMAGFDSPYVPGWDCHGLPIEIKVDSELGAKKAKMSAAEIRRECRKYAEKFVDLQREDFKRLGVLGRWDDPYLTMSAQYQSVIAGAFVDFLDRGYVYKGLKPVHWCIRDRTALAEAEVEYEEHQSPSIWVRFALTSDPAAIDPALAGKPVYGLIWTTTPWTIPANMAIAYNPRFDYVAVDVAGDVYLVAADLLNVTAEKCGWSGAQVLATFTGDRLEGAIFRHPLLERDSPGILADHVTLEQGTGAVHTAPGHGQEDYAIGQKYGIATFCPVDAAGRFFRAEGAPGHIPDDLIGKTVWEGNPLVIEHLKAAGALLALERVGHSYPHCWRCHNPVIFRATEQWFIGMERNNFRGDALEAIRRVKWMPSWGEERISNMIAVRPDWCISRQRVWGVPIIVFYCEGCREPVTDRAILDGVVQAHRRAHRRRLVRALRRRTAPRRPYLRQMRRLRVFQGNRHSRRLVRFRLQPPGRAQSALRTGVAGRCLPGRRRPVPRLVPQFAAGGHGAARAGRLTAPACSTAGCWMAKARPCTSRSAMPSNPKRSSRNTARTSCGCGAPRWNSTRTCACPPPSSRGWWMRTASCATPSATCSATSTASIPRRTPCPPENSPPSTSGSCCAPKTWWRAAAPGTTNSRSTRSITPSTPSARWT